MKIIPFLTLLILFVFANMVDANATSMSVKVIDVSLKGEEYTVQLEPQDNKFLSKRITIHLRFNPKKAAFAASASRKDFDSALKTLKASATTKMPIQIGLMSGKGFNPIKNRPDHYRSEMIQIVDWFQEPDVVCFFHSDWYVTAPK